MTMQLQRYTKIDGVMLGESVFVDGPALWVNAKEVAHAHDREVDVRIGRKHIRARGLAPRRPSSDWCVLPAKHTALLAELIELAASQHRVDNPKAPPTDADLERRKSFH